MMHGQKNIKFYKLCIIFPYMIFNKDDDIANICD